MSAVSSLHFLTRRFSDSCDFFSARYSVSYSSRKRSSCGSAPSSCSTFSKSASRTSNWPLSKPRFSKPPSSSACGARTKKKPTGECERARPRAAFERRSRGERGVEAAHHGCQGHSARHRHNRLASYFVLPVTRFALALRSGRHSQPPSRQHRELFFLNWRCSHKHTQCCPIRGQRTLTRRSPRSPSAMRCAVGRNSATSRAARSSWRCSTATSHQC